jgi:hypothetical protein
VELGRLEIKYPNDGNNAVVFKVYRYDKFSRPLPLTSVPMPEYIKNFEEIYIRFIFVVLIKSSFKRFDRAFFFGIFLKKGDKKLLIHQTH